MANRQRDRRLWLDVPDLLKQRVGHLSAQFSRDKWDRRTKQMILRLLNTHIGDTGELCTVMHDK